MVCGKSDFECSVVAILDEVRYKNVSAKSYENHPVTSPVNHQDARVIVLMCGRPPIQNHGLKEGGTRPDSVGERQ